MSSDVESLYDPEAAEETTQVLDATVIGGRNNGDTPSTATAHSSKTSSSQSEETASKDDVPIATDNSIYAAPRRRWFILEPAVFLVFLAMYLSGISIFRFYA